jgi:hypothetical protein
METEREIEELKAQKIKRHEEELRRLRQSTTGHESLLDPETIMGRYSMDYSDPKHRDPASVMIEGMREYAGVLNAIARLTGR